MVCSNSCTLLPSLLCLMCERPWAILMTNLTHLVGTKVPPKHLELERWPIQGCHTHLAEYVGV